MQKIMPRPDARRNKRHDTWSDERRTIKKKIDLLDYIYGYDKK